MACVNCVMLWVGWFDAFLAGMGWRDIDFACVFANSGDFGLGLSTSGFGLLVVPWTCWCVVAVLLVVVVVLRYFDFWWWGGC